MGLTSRGEFPYLFIQNYPKYKAMEKIVFKKKIFGFWFYVSRNRMRVRSSRDEAPHKTQLKHVKNKIWNERKHVCFSCGKPLLWNEVELHHIIRWYWQDCKYEFDERNIQMVCHDCHKEIHRNPLIEAKLIRKVCKKLGIKIKDLYI